MGDGEGGCSSIFNGRGDEVSMGGVGRDGYSTRRVFSDGRNPSPVYINNIRMSVFLFVCLSVCSRDENRLPNG